MPKNLVMLMVMSAKKFFAMMTIQMTKKTMFNRMMA